MNASNSLLHAYVHDEIVLRGDEHRLLGLINQMRLFAPPDVVGTAEAVMRAIIEISLKPSAGLRQLATEALSKNPDPDPLQAESAGQTWTTCAGLLLDAVTARQRVFLDRSSSATVRTLCASL